MSKRFEDRIVAPKELFLSLADGLVDRGHTVFVYTATGVKTKAKLIGGNELLESTALPSTKNRIEDDQLQYRMDATEYEMDLSSRAFLHAKENKLDVMHIYIVSFAQYIGVLSDIPSVVTIHDPLLTSETLEGWHYRNFKTMPYVAISENQKKQYGSDYNIVDVVYHGVDPTSFSFSNEHDGYLGFVGRLIKEKGVEDALAASRKVDMPLHIATSGNYLETDYYKGSLKDLIEQSHAVMTGYMFKSARDAWMKKARALLFPIHWEEPFGMVMLEAMACGTPVIAYNRGSVPEIVKDGVTGFIVDEKKGVEGLVEAIGKLDTIDRSVCRKHVEEHFSAKMMAAGYEKVYKKVLHQA